MMRMNLPIQLAKPGPLQMLVSVRSVPEALAAARHGADFIDLKEPSQGALGGLPLAGIAAIVQALRSQGLRQPISATIGDLPMAALTAVELAAVLDRVRAVAACGVNHVKVGVSAAAGPRAAALLAALATAGPAVIPVFIADQGLDPALIAQGCGLGFPALMVDTADKRAGSLFDLASEASLARFIAQVQASGALAGLAGALRLPQLPALQALAPDFAGFRSAVCAGDRGGELDPLRLRDLADRLRSGVGLAPGAMAGAPAHAADISAPAPAAAAAAR